MELLKSGRFILYLILFFSFGCIYPATNMKPSSIPSANSTIPPNTNIGGTGYVTQRFIVTGYVYDNEKKLLSDAKVTIKWLNNQDKQGNEITEFITGLNGLYYFRNIPENTDVEITAYKPGYATVVRKENINSNLYLSGIYNINFGGEGNSSIYALEKIN